MNPATTRQRHALVIGGSMGGLLAARVLTERFEQVTVLDRDAFPELPEHRSGVPQSPVSKLPGLQVGARHPMVCLA